MKYADVYECDVVGTKDGELVLFHDKRLNRMTNSNEFIWDVNYADIPPYKEKIVVQSAPFEPVYHRQVNDTDNKMGKLDDLLIALPTQKISIEFKEKNWTTIENTMKKLKGHESRVRITSRNLFIASKIRVHYPEFSTE